MKIAYKYKKDGCNTELHLDNVNRIRQKGKIELLPDETSSMSGDEMLGHKEGVAFG